MKRTLFVAALALLAGTAQAQTLTGKWIVDQNGCKFWDTSYDTSDRTITWSGKCVKGFAEGQGTLKMFEKGEPFGEYTGAMRSGKRHGNGTYTMANGDRYQGGWVDGVRHGKGTHTWPIGNRYEGDWVAGKMHGKGTFTWVNGERYEGDWVAGKMHGKGNQTVAGGIFRYQGDFVGDKPHGFGVSTEGGITTRDCWYENKKVRPANSPEECRQ